MKKITKRFFLEKTKTKNRTQLLLTVMMLLFVAFSGVSGWAQTTIAQQDFETTPATPTLSFTISGGAFTSGSTAASAAAPLNSPLFSGGARGYGANNTTATLTSGDINTVNYSTVALSCKLGSFSTTSTGNGADAGDFVKVEISPDGGTTYYVSLWQEGSSNTTWAFSNASTYTRVYSTTPLTAAGRTAAAGTLTITGLPSTTNLRVRISMLNNATAELWAIDDVRITGTLLSAPTVTSPTSASVSTTTATLGGNVTSDGGASITERGVVYSLTTANADPTIGGGSVTKVTTAGTTGVFTTGITGLTAGAGYSYKAYAINSAGTTYTTGSTFTTVALTAPLVTSPTAASLGVSSAVLGGNVTSDGNSTITERGVVYAETTTNGDPLISATGVTKLTTSGTTGVFTLGATGLASATGYSYKAYAINGVGTTYTTVSTFSTTASAIAPTVTSPTGASIINTYATLGGNVTSDGGATITEIGVVYSLTSANGDPLIDGSGVTKVTGAGTTGIFTISATGLTAGAGYSYKAYAINAQGTTYSSVSTFATLTVPTVTTPTSASVSYTTATLGGTVTTDGGATITERGVVYAITTTNGDPLISGTGVTKVTGTGTTGVFTVSATGLTSATGYSYKAYAINTYGTTYSSVSTFTTLTTTAPGAPTIGTATVATATSVSVPFTAPASDGGSTITSYTVTSNNGITATGGSSPIVVTGLTTGTPYTFTVTATNIIGTGTSSGSSNSVTPNIVNATPILWSSAAGSAWLSTGNWTGSALPTASQIAQFAVNPTPGTSVNINGGITSAGAIEMANTRLINLTIGNNSGSASNGTLTLNGVNVNSTSNVILRNNSANLLTIQNTGSTGSGSNTMAVALANTTNNIIDIDGTGGITISSVISGGNPLTLEGSGSGTLTLSGTNTYTGATTVSSSTSRLIVSRAGYTATITRPSVNTTVVVAFSPAPANGAYAILPGVLTIDGTLAFSVTGLNANQTVTFNATTSTVTVGSITPASTTLTAFTTTFGTVSTVQTVAITGTNLTGNIVTSTAPTGYELSSDGTTYAATATFPSTGGSLRIRLAATAAVAGSYNGQVITLTNGNASSTVTTAASGNSVGKATPTITTPPTATAIALGQTLALSTLSGGAASVLGTFTFTTPSTSPTAGTASQSVTFTPDNAASFNNATTTASVTVSDVTTFTNTGTPSWSFGVPTSTNMNAVIAADYGTGNGVITAKNLTVNSGVRFTVNGGANGATISEGIVNNGFIVVEMNANLIQTATTNTNTSGINARALVHRNSNPLYRLDYTMWSSPVSGAQTLAGFSPLTTPLRNYVYNPSTNVYNSVGNTGTFITGKGYLIRMPDQDKDNLGNQSPYYKGVATLAYEGGFDGTSVNNGTITITATAGTYNAVGNPYPSTISADSFITANGITDGLYFWRKTNGPAVTAYARYTSMGGAGTGPGTGGITPNGTIQVGQGFIVKATGDLVFNNTMRATPSSSTQFFKTKAQGEKSRIWLNLNNADGMLNQTLVGYVDGATLGVDNGIDGKSFGDGTIELASSIDGASYTIQGRPAFDAADVVSLNFKTSIAGTYNIAIDKVDGLFSKGQDIFLVDKTAGTTTNLNEGAYTFTAAVGVDNTRFTLTYQKTLKVDAPLFNENSVLVSRSNGIINVKSTAVAINNVKVFDIQGRLIAERKNVKSNSTSFSNLRTNQVLIVKVTAENNAVVTKKVLN